jgi:phosphoethanolamine N-methyltransferase
MSETLQYTESTVARLEMLWGEGFMSVGGPEEVAAIIAGENLNERHVVDIGCGIGGVDLLLVKQHGAASVIGLDVEEHLLDRGRELADKAGFADRVTFRMSGSLPLPVSDNACDVVFSKGAILHIPDKRGLMWDLARMLKPGGLFVASDWLRGEGAAGTDRLSNFGAAGIALDLTHQTAMVDALSEAGFRDIRVVDRTEDYLARSRRDLATMRDNLRDRATALLGAEGFEHWLTLQERTVAALAARQVQPTHLRALLKGT